jgi:hypothetical protein
MDTAQAARIARAREVLETRHGFDPESMAAQIGKLDYWLRDMTALAEQLGGPPPTERAPAPRTEAGPCFGADCDHVSHQWSAPPGLEGYDYTLPKDYLRGGPAVVADLLGDVLNKWPGRFDTDARTAITQIRHTLLDIAEGAGYLLPEDYVRCGAQ